MSRTGWIVAGVVGAAFVGTVIGVVQCQRAKEQAAPGSPRAASITATEVVLVDEVPKNRTREMRLTTLDSRTGKRLATRFADTAPSDDPQDCKTVQTPSGELTWDGTHVGFNGWKLSVRCQAMAVVDDLVVIATDDAARRAMGVDAKTGQVRWTFRH